MSTKPRLSELSSNSWDSEFSDLDAIIARESSAPVATNTTTNYPTTRQDAPVSTQQNNPTSTEIADRSGKAYVEENNRILNQELGAGLANTRFEDSGTKTPQQNLNQQPTTTPQQQNEGSQQNNTNDPYLLAFEILQDFDLIRLPQNVDYSKLDEQTLTMYKEETLQEQRNEALDFVRGQVAHDPLMAQLFDYAYYGKQFADLPRMQTVLKEIHDFAAYDLTTEAAQKALVKLYYSDGLNPADDRDQKVLAMIPVQIKQLTIDLQLKAEAQKAQRFFIERSRAKAAQEEQRVLLLMARQEEIERERIAEANKWNDAFKTALASKAWTEGKKANVLKEMNYVKLQSGEEMPLWQYKQNLMLDNPALFQTFLDFMSQFNPDKQVFETPTEDAITQSTLNQIVQRLQSKSSTPTQVNGGAQEFNNTQQKKPRVVDVQNDWFN